MHGPLLRRGVEADAAAVTRIHITSMRAAMPYLPVVHDEQQTLDFFTNVVLCEQEVWVAVRSERVEGFISFHAGRIEHLYVDPESQSLGIGSMLLQKAKDESNGRLELYVYLRNTDARRFYEKNGFSLVEMSSGSDNEHKEPDGLYMWRRLELLAD